MISSLIFVLLTTLGIDHVRILGVKMRRFCFLGLSMQFSGEDVCSFQFADIIIGPVSPSAI